MNMKLLSTTLVTIVQVVLLSISFGSSRKPKDVLLPLLCEFPPGAGPGVRINQSVVVEADSYTELTLDLCNITMATSNLGNGILINFLTFDIGKTCDDGSVEIFDYYTGDSITGQLCGHSLKKTVFRAHTRVVNLVATPRNSTLGYPPWPRLDILFTSYNSGTAGKCSKGEFQCDSKLCIAGDLVCNGYNECSDNSDERHCGVKPSGHTTSVDVAIVVGGVIGGAAVLALLVLGVLGCQKYVRHRKQRGYEPA